MGTIVVKHILLTVKIGSVQKLRKDELCRVAGWEKNTMLKGTGFITYYKKITLPLP